MNLEIITGVGESAHVSSTDQQAIYQGIVGSGIYVFRVGSMLSADVTTNNLITVKDGVFCVGGIMGRIPSGATDGIAIENGTSGVSRTDLIVIEYKKTGAIETLEWKVLKGTTAYQEGDTLNGDVLIQFPMYKVTINGLSVEKVERQFSYANQIAGSKDNVSITGSVVFDIKSSTRIIKLFTDAEVSSILGVNSNMLNTNVCASNGDSFEDANCIIGCYHYKGVWYVKLEKAWLHQIRINYTISYTGGN